MKTRLILLSVISTGLALPTYMTINAFAGNSPEPIAGTPASSINLPSRDAAAERLSQALRFRTISTEGRETAHGEFIRLHEFLVQRFPHVHKRLKRTRFNQHSLLFEWPGSDPSLKPILLLAHQDVVPVPAPETWHRSPFAGIRENGYIRGRGTIDDKAAVMGILEAVESLIATGFQPSRSIYLAFGHDEEIGGLQGAAAIARHFRSRSTQFEFILDEGMIIGDGLIPGVERPVALIGIAQKGILNLELKVEGVPGHSSMPPPSTAVGIVSRAIVRLEAKPMPAALDGALANMFDTLGPHMSGFHRFLFTNRRLLAPLLVHQLKDKPRLNAGLRTTMAATIIRGGDKINVLPTGARARLNFRIHPRDSIRDVLAHVRNVISDERVQIRKLVGAVEPSDVSPIDARGYKRLSRAIRSVFPQVVVAPTLFLAASDTRHFQDLSENIHRFRPTRLKLEDIKRIHGKDERISEKNYFLQIKFYRQLIENTTRP